ncbi:MAG TPA: TRAP transporter small permease subunit [Gammaproteobacteria bacterium]|nr:TRAP transporter small permease subunit [Gammaproteobacteria bacterium]
MSQHDDSVSPPPRPARLAHALTRFNAWVGRSVAWATLLMVLVTFFVVLLRYGFNLGFIAMQESIAWLHALVFLLGAAWTLGQDGHVRVDIFYRRMSPRHRHWVDLLGTLFLLVPMCVFIFVIGWDYVASSWALHEASPEAGGLPGVWLLKTLLLIMPALVLLQGLAQLLTSVLVLRGHLPADATPGGHPPHDEVI